MITSKFFNMGQVVVTRSINDLMAAEQKFAVEVAVALQRYAVKDWGIWMKKINRQTKKP